ncbi:MAG: hypothetical protein O2857_25590 [Planctomycetota bacterium]|nr:hypothetical protein [Planctomycetota bacterium]
MKELLQWLGMEKGADVFQILEHRWYAAEPLSERVVWCIVLFGLLVACINFLPQISMRTSVRVRTFFLRLGMVAVLLFCLNRVELHLELQLNRRQEWVALVDDSASMSYEEANGQSRYALAKEDLKKLQDSVGDSVRLSVRSFSGGTLGETAGKGPTRFKEAISRAALSRSNVDRLILFTDGRDSDQRDLSSIGEDLKARSIQVSAKLFGSASPPRDSQISAEPDRTILRLGEALVVRGAISGEIAGASYTVLLKENSKKVSSVTVTPDMNGRFEFRYRPPKKGKPTYTVELDTKDALAENNQTSFTATIIDEKINVLLIEGFPRFEFKIVKAALEIDELVNLVSITHLPGGGVFVQGNPLHRNPQEGLITSQADLFMYDVVFLRDLARNYFRAGGDTTETRLQNIVQFVTKRGGGLIVSGGADVYKAGGYETSALAEILPFDLSSSISGQDQFKGMFFVSIPKTAYQHPLLRLLPDDNENRERLNSLRDLDGSNNVGRFKPLATPLMTRMVTVTEKGGRIAEKEAPLMGYIAVGEGKVLATAADTHWRWHLQTEFEDTPLAGMLANAVRYLAPLPGQEPGKPSVSIGDGTPQVGQDLIMSTELRDKNYDPIRNAEIVVTVFRPDESSYRMYPRDLPEEPGHYEYRVRLDQPGLYKVKAKYGNFESEQEFLAGAAAGEFSNLSGDPEGLGRLIEKSDGEWIKDYNSWLASVDKNATQFSAVRDLEAWNSPALLVLFFLLVCADCYVRKRQGLV